MTHLWPLIHTVLQGQLAAGGLLLMAVGSLIAMLKTVPLTIWNGVVRQTTVAMSITDDSDSFEWFKWWFQEQPSIRRTRLLDAYTPYGSDHKVFVTPGPGAHWLWYMGRPLRVTLTRTENTTSYKRRQCFYLQTLGRNPKIMQNLLGKCYRSYLAQTHDKSAMFTVNNDKNWVQLASYAPRSLKSVILPEGVIENLVRDIEFFQASKDWYMSMGIPYRRGYMLHGLPGAGKTSLINGIANHFHLKVCPINLNNVTDSTLSQMILTAPSNALILLEDVDCARATEKRLDLDLDKDKKDGLENLMMGLSLSGLLNALDGAQSANGALFFMTTNHLDKLDPALLRDGRTDVRIEFTTASTDQKRTLYMRFFPNTSEQEMIEFLANNTTTTIAELQGVLLRERNKQLSDTLVMSATNGGRL
jgi:chaperone BCS1